MNNPSALAQLRKGFDAQIAQSPDVIVLRRPVMVDDGFGGTVADPFGRTTTVSFTGRLSHERNGLAGVGEVPAGLDTALSLFLQWRYNVTVNQDERISARGRVFRVDAPDAVKKFGGVYCNQAPLHPAGDSSGWVTGVSLNGTDPTALSPLGTFQLLATIAPLTPVDTSVLWSSSDTDVVTVDSTGLVTAVSVGTATVTATTHDGSFTASRVFEVSV